jgi:hypothetical protein
MGLFDFLKPKQKPEDETYTPIIPPDQEVYLIDLDDTVKPEEYAGFLRSFYAVRT